MNEGKNRWTVAYLESERWNVRLDVTHHQRLSTKEELRIFKSGFIDYYTVDFLFAIFKNKGECITGDLKGISGRTQSTNYVLDLVNNFKDSDTPLLSEEETLTFIYLEKLYKLTQNKMLSREDYEQFKRIYHALQRGDIDIVILNLTGRNQSHGITEIKAYKPRNTLNGKE